jgi:hypothetical protein
MKPVVYVPRSVVSKGVKFALWLGAWGLCSANHIPSGWFLGGTAVVVFLVRWSRRRPPVLPTEWARRDMSPEEVRALLQTVAATEPDEPEPPQQIQARRVD